MSKRERFNELKIKVDAAGNTEKAALMIFLNKTCFNGLYRVNRKGLFNVPMGAYKNPLICDENNLWAVSDKLKNVKIVCGDYSKSENFIDENTFDDEKQIVLAGLVKETNGKEWGCCQKI